MSLYSRFDRDPLGWVVMKNGFMFCQKEKRETTHIDSKTFLSVHYRRTKQVTHNTLHQNLSGGVNFVDKSGGEATSSSSLITIGEELVVKHEINVSVQSFDVICVASPVLSSVSVFTSALKNCIGFNSSRMQPSHSPNKQIPLTSSQKQQQQQQPKGFGTQEGAKNIITWPVTTVYCDSVRVVMPYGDDTVDQQPMIIGDDEQLLLLHLHSVAVTSSPVNPITKTVIDKTTYQQLKQSHREPMKKLKLWNVQYQLDITNIGLCTTSWKSVKSSLPENKTMLGEEYSSQNPAAEWNKQMR